MWLAQGGSGEEGAKVFLYKGGWDIIKLND